MRYLYLAGLLAFLSIGVLACYEPREGCLDVEANNFSVDADRACSDCCTYPSLRLTFQHRSVYPDTVVAFQLADSVYLDAAGQPYRVQDLRFLLSDFRLVRSDGSELPMSNRLAVRVFAPDGSLKPDSIINDVLLMRPSLNSRLTAGTMRASGRFAALRFRIGLTEVTANVDPASLPAVHPLRPASSGLDWSQAEGFEFQRMKLLLGLTGADSLVISTRRAADRQTIEIPLDVNVPPGYNLELDIRIDYFGWLRDISPSTQPPSQVLNRWIARSSGAFAMTGFRYSLN